MNVSLLKIQLHNQRNAYPTDPKRGPNENGSTMKGNNRIMKTVKTIPTQILYKRLSTDLRIFKGGLLISPELWERESSQRPFEVRAAMHVRD